MARELWGKTSVNSVKVSTPDITDGQIVIQSSCGASQPLPRGFSDEFSFSDTDLVIVNNRGGDKATVRLQGMLTPQEAIYVGSTRRGGFLLRGRETRTVPMQAGEVLTLRSAHAVEPNSRTRMRPGGIPIRSGQITPTAD